MEAAEVIKAFMDFFEKNCTEKILTAQSFFEVDFSTLSQWNLDLANELLNSPEDTIKAAEIALEQMTIAEGRKLSIWFMRLPETQQRNVWEIRKEDVGPFIGLKGIINKASSIKHICKEARFECSSCGNAVNIIQMDEQFKEPTKCLCGARSRFRILQRVMVDTVKLGLIDDLMDRANADRSIAREKLSILSGPDLTSHETDMRIKPGKKVILNGYFKYVQKKEGSTEFDSLFEVNSIEFVQVGWDIVKVSEKEAEQIRELAKEKDIIERLAESITDVKGYPEVKQACLLQLAGAPHIYDKNHHLASRGTIHVLLVSDPGAAKTYLIKRAGAISPIFSFQSAATASGKGLVVSVAQDKEIGNWALYPGVVAMASHGIVGLDEIDKTHKDDYGDHNNAMNDMVVPVAKATVKARIEAETSYLATANPTNRIFTSYEPLHAQIDMPKDFLDRFDIIFPMVTPIDKAVKDKIMDIMLERHVEDAEQLIWKPEFTHEFIRNYIAYCRQHKPRPSLSRDLFYTIKKRLTELMKPSDEEKAKVSFRQLENIMRFAYASSRLRLRDVTEEDIDLAFRLKFKSFTDLGIISASGEFSWAKLEDVNEEQISDDKKMHDVILELLPDKEKLADIQEIVDACIKKGVKEEKVEEYLKKKQMIGDYIEPRRGKLQRM